MRRKRYIFPLLFVGTVVYALWFPRPLGKELVVQAGWQLDLARTEVAPPEEDAWHGALPFRLGERFGYVSRDGKLLARYEVLHDLALAPAFFLNYSSVPDTLLISAPDGTVRGVLGGTGYPYIRRGRIFLLSPTMSEVSEWTPSGERRWRREFDAVITSLDAGTDTVVVGLDSGMALVLDSSGATLKQTSPLGSRIPVILSVAISQDDRYIAVVSGIDPEKLSLLEWTGRIYRDGTQYLLKGEYRRYVESRFVGATGHLLVEQPSSLGLLHPGSRGFLTLPFKGEVRSFSENRVRGLFSAAVMDDEALHLHWFLPGGRRVWDFSVPYQEPVFFQVVDDGFVFGRGERLYKLALEER